MKRNEINFIIVWIFKDGKEKNENNFGLDTKNKRKEIYVIFVGA